MSTQTKRFAVIGDPVGHSLSPVMQRAAFAALGLSHSFDALLVTKEQLPALLDRVRRGDLHGINVTAPHKVAALSLCDFFTDEVGLTGAVNTIFVDATGRLVGSNTDVDGLRADLLSEGLVPKSALVLGSGGAARSALVAISQLDARVCVAGRDDGAARKVVQAAARGTAVPWASLGEANAPYDLIVNATSAGMQGGSDGSPIAEAWTRAPKSTSCVAYDLVYRPAETLFLRRAVEQGHRAISGLGMLVEQGARALSVFLGVPIDVAIKRAMRNAAAVALSGPS